MPSLGMSFTPGDIALRNLDGIEFPCVIVRRDPKTFVAAYDVVYPDDQQVERSVLSTELVASTERMISSSCAEDEIIRSLAPKLLQVGLSKLETSQQDTEVVGAEGGSWDTE